jgi:hypothetical protein
MTKKQGEWKYGVYVATPEEAREAWEKRKEMAEIMRNHANNLCQCCHRVTDYKKCPGSLHHRNGNKQDFSLMNLLWLCRTCYDLANGLTEEITIEKLRAELT